MKIRVFGLWAVVCVGLVSLTVSAAGISKQCADGKECLIEVPGTQCADGTPSYITLTQRKDAKNLLVYLKGGGACWNQKSCENGLARPLTREETPTDWQSGSGIHDAGDNKNPFRESFNVITVPYCSGDAFTGNRDANYGSASKPYIIRHHGYDNVVKSLAVAKTLFPNPEKAVMLGCSAGGIGALYHFRNFHQAFDKAKKYVVSDAGTPFKPPYLYPTNYANVMKAWGADGTIPVVGGKPLTNFGEVVAYNTKEYADTRFGFISSYRDTTMSFFSFSVGSSSPLTAVKRIIIDVADNDIGRDTSYAKVFYTESSRHCHTPEALAEMTSLNNNLGDWLTAMVDDSASWQNSRPDLVRRVKSAEDAGESIQMVLP